MAIYTVSISNAGTPDTVALGDGSTLAKLEVSAGRGPKGDGFTGGSYEASTGVVTFTSNEGLGFSTDDLRSFTDGSYNSTTGEVTFTSNTGVGFTTGDIRGGSIDETLGQIATTKTETAVDVFVYDTSRDSDGGAWRKRTQHTSWYNETLNTSTRGSRREFPAVAVIVAEATKVTIYDGDDPALPMWMVFNEGGGGSNFNFMIPGSTRNGCTALNGKLCVSNGSNALIEISFIDERVQQRYSIGMFFWAVEIVDRNATPLRLGGTDSANRIISSNVNDVAMTVLPDAPIDPATGLPVPTIAVATDGGVSVIKDDGTVVDNSSTVFFGAVSFSSDGNLIFQRGSQGRIYANKPPFSDGFFADGDRNYAALGTIPAVISDNQTYALSFKGKETFYAGFFEGLVSLNENRDDATKGMVAYTTSTYNTGWMNGDIKGAFLSDTDDTDLVGSGELVTNGTFDSGVSGWTAFTTPIASSTISVVDSKLRMTKTGASAGWCYQTLTGLTVGATYFVSVDQLNNNSSVTISDAEGSVGGADIVVSTGYGSAGTRTLVFVATATTLYVNLGTTASTSDFDNISVKLADADRSVNNNGLVVTGSIARDPVSSGADLVAYSGFSA